MDASATATYLPLILQKANQLHEVVSTRLRDFKNSNKITEKLDVLAETLRNAEKTSLKNESFFSNLNEVSATLDAIQYQVDKYLRVNRVKRKFIASSTRHKITSLLQALTFSIRLIDAVFVRPP